MATKVYLPSSGAAAVTPSSWLFTNVGAAAVTYAGVLTKIASAFTSIDENTGTINPYTEGVLRYVLGPVSAQTITGTVRAVMRVSESHTATNANLRMAIKIIQPNGADRAILLDETSSDSASAPYEMTTTLSSKRVWTSGEAEPLTLTDQAASTGDYVVIEIGHRSSTGTDRTISYNIGDNSANDLAYGDDETNAYCPWVEFSMNITMQTVISLDTATITAGGLQLDVQPGSMSINLDTATIAAGGQQLDIQPGSVSISLDTATIAASGPQLDVQPGAVTIALDDAVITADGQTIIVSTAGSTVINLNCAVITADGQTIDVQPGAVTVNLDAAALSAGGIQFDVQPGLVTIHLDTALITAGGLQIDVQPGSVTVPLDTATITADGRKINVVTVVDVGHGKFVETISIPIPGIFG